MIKVERLRHIAIIANNLQVMRDFYTKVLGFKVVKEIEIGNEDFRKGVGIAGAKAQGIQLQIPNSNVEIEIFEFAPKLKGSNDLSLTNYPGFRHIALAVDNIDEAYKELKELNIEFISEPICVTEPLSLAGFKFAYFKDPEGNIIELNQLPNS